MAEVQSPESGLTPGKPTSDPRRSETSYWHPFANMAKIKDRELVLVEGRGCEVTDSEGRRYLDATAGLWYCNVGYGRTEIVDAVARQLHALPSYSTFGPYATEPTLTAARRIAEYSRIENAAVFLTSGGSDAVETAAKLVRSYWAALGQPERRILVGRPRAYHGMHAYGTSLAGIPANRETFGDMVPDVAHVGEDSVEAVEREFERIGPERIGAFIGEPVVGAGGVFAPPDGYWSGVTELCRRHEVLLIADEVISGFGRLGHSFGSERYGIEPDMITFAKGVTSGYMPLGGVVISPRVKEPFWQGEGRWFRHGYTYSGHAGACAAALVNLDILQAEDLAGRTRSLEPVFERSAQELLGHPLVGAVRTAGLLCAVELAPDALEARPSLTESVVLSCREQGVLTRALGLVAIQVSPALVIDEDQIKSLFSRIGQALDAVGQPV
jgi:putrescine aminotransferase